jgi:hypothetical protein
MAGPGSTKKVVIMGSDGSHGYLSYSIHGSTLEIGQIEITDQNLRSKPGENPKRISNLLYERVLLEHPEINTIGGVLVDVNLKKYWEARHGPPPKSHIEALKSTPAYRARAAAGFTEIDVHDSSEPLTDGGMPQLVTKKPAPASERRGEPASPAAPPSNGFDQLDNLQSGDFI